MNSMHDAMAQLQAALITVLNADAGLTSLVGADPVFDAPPKGRKPPYVTIIRHDAEDRSEQAGEGFAHRLAFQVWMDRTSRTDTLAIAARVGAVGLGASLSMDDFLATHRHLERTETFVDLKTGWTRATVRLRVMTEPQ